MPYPMPAAPVPAVPKPASALPTLLAALLALAAAGCGGGERVTPTVASEPTDAVALLTRHLRDNDLRAFARDAVPPELRPQLAAAWQAGRTRWPLEELPFDHKIPGMLAVLAADKADTRLRRSFEGQFANANGEIRAAAKSLGLFGVKFLQTDIALSAEERAHYAQLVAVLSDWGTRAKLADPKRARGTIARLTLAARQSGLREETDFRRYGMDDTLRRLTPVVAALKESLRAYDLDLDRSLNAMTLSLVSQEGDQARVRMRYPLDGKTIDTVVAVERIDGRWYLSDFLGHARAAAAVPPGPATPAAMPPAPAPPAPADAPPGASPVVTPPETAMMKPTSS